MALLKFDASTVEAPSFDPIPSGVYEAVIVESKLQETKSGNGQLLVLTFEIVSGDYAGRKIWEYLNIAHSNPTAVTIALQTLAAICKAVGLTQVDDSSELHDIPMYITVKVRRMADGEDRNEIKGYRAREAFETPTKSPSKGTQTASISPTTSVKTDNPWMR